mmetsp:Transcript_21061/g.60086  ORF Transcript_21061/g.60086 Transcript_21061/m.60086 type:complete len:106 (+) Transcript_21061:75-392(+)
MSSQRLRSRNACMHTYDWCCIDRCIGDSPASRRAKQSWRSENGSTVLVASSKSSTNVKHHDRCPRTHLLFYLVLFSDMLRSAERLHVTTIEEPTNLKSCRIFLWL